MESTQYSNTSGNDLQIVTLAETWHLAKHFRRGTSGKERQLIEALEYHLETDRAQ